MLRLLVTSFCDLRKREHSELHDSVPVEDINCTKPRPAPPCRRLFFYTAGFGVNNPELTDRASTKPQTLVSQNARKKQRSKTLALKENEKLQDTESKGEKESNK